MERSSPLAAMQPPSLPFGHWGCRGGAESSYSQCGGQFGGHLNFGPSSFNFKDLSMAKAPTDYFSLKPVRGSSPTASLAADLSQNFHIDQRYYHSLRYCCFDTTLTAPVRNCQLHVDHCSPRTSLGHSMAEVRCACRIGQASANTEQNARARRRSLPLHLGRWKYHRCRIRPLSLSHPMSSLHL